MPVWLWPLYSWTTAFVIVHGCYLNCYCLFWLRRAYSTLHPDLLPAEWRFPWRCLNSPGVRVWWMGTPVVPEFEIRFLQALFFGRRSGTLNRPIRSSHSPLTNEIIPFSFIEHCTPPLHPLCLIHVWAWVRREVQLEYWSHAGDPFTTVDTFAYGEYIGVKRYILTAVFI